MILTNLLLRGGGALVALGVFQTVTVPLHWIGQNEASQIAHLHLLFNLIVVIIGLALRGVICRIARNILGFGVDPEDRTGRSSALDTALLSSPNRALTNAAREIVHMGETSKVMHRLVNGLFQTWDNVTATTVTTQAKLVWSKHQDVKLFLTKLNQGFPGEATSQRAMDLSVIAAKLEMASAAIIRSMMNLAQQIDRNGLVFSKEDLSEISDFRKHVLSNVQLALNAMTTRDITMARELIREKKEIRCLERSLQLAHWARLQQDPTESFRSSTVHQEALRTLKQMNSAFAMIAQPVLMETGELMDWRLSTENHGRGLANGYHLS